mgnify:CR=1 FL=1
MKNFILAVENVPKPMLIAEAVLIVLIIGVVAIRFFIIRSKPAYLKKLPRAVYDEETIHLLFNCYKAADSIEGMLHLAVKKSRNRKNKKRFKAAISYLYTSRYKDYETALYKYAGDRYRTDRASVYRHHRQGSSKETSAAFKGGIISEKK